MIWMYLIQFTIVTAIRYNGQDGYVIVLQNRLSIFFTEYY
uniref:Uncharacterized protein n=1 Tax=Setaria italica TaxID=4555 RepID=K3XUL4_SETIT